MTRHSGRRKQAKILRLFRKVHRTTGAFLFVFFFCISVTGLLLGWKKHSNGTILPKTYKGTSAELKDWLPLDSLHKNSCTIMRNSVSKNPPPELERIDVRKDKGIIKFVYSDYYGVQLDGATGKLLNIDKRNSDLIENIHDGSVLDHYFGTTHEQIKLIYTTVMGLALLTFTVTGFWLWYGVRRIKNSRKRQMRRKLQS